MIKSGFRGEVVGVAPIVVISAGRYRITREGKRSDIFDFGAWYSKCSGYCCGPVWRLYKRVLLFGWIRQSTTNDPGIVLRWKKEYFSTEVLIDEGTDFLKTARKLGSSEEDGK